jgi:predicted nucleotidyltransferase
MDTKSVINTVEAYISDVKRHGYDVSEAYLFGSVAKGGSDDDSDIDVAILLGDIGDTWKMQVEMMKIRRVHDIRIEPHVFSSDYGQSPFLDEIKSTGIPVNTGKKK